MGAPYNLQWFFDAEDERRTFDISYTVRNAATVAPDVAEVYWKWVGETHPEIDLVTATLTVPAGDGEVLAWGHGELTGEVTVDGDTVRWVAPDVPDGSFVEGRVAIPSSRVHGPPGRTRPPRHHRRRGDGRGQEPRTSSGPRRPATPRRPPSGATWRRWWSLSWCCSGSRCSPSCSSATAASPRIPTSASTCASCPTTRPRSSTPCATGAACNHSRSERPWSTSRSAATSP